MEDGPFEDVFPIENGGFSIAMLVCRRVPGARFLNHQVATLEATEPGVLIASWIAKVTASKLYKWGEMGPL